MSVGIPSPKIWLIAARPKTWVAAFAPVLMGIALAVEDGVFHWPSAVLALFGALLIQVATNFVNDYYDFKKGADNQDRKGPIRVMQAGLVTEKQMKGAMITTFALAFGVGCYLVFRGGILIAAIGVLSLVSGYLYTAGPYPLAYIGLGDLFVLIFFGPVAVAGTYFVQALELRADALFLGLAPGLFGAALLAVNNLRDIEEDRRAGKKTLVVRFGAGFGKVEYILTITLACLVPYVSYLRSGRHPWELASSLVLFAAFPAVKSILHEKDFSFSLARTCTIFLCFSLLFSLGRVISP